MSTGIETERKFIVKIPDFALLSREREYTVSRITQTYLHSEKGVTRRVRRREYADRTRYYETKKIRLGAMSAIEEEEEIDEAHYLVLLEQKRAGTDTLHKVRHTVFFDGFTYEFDVYPQWCHSCIMEVELPSEQTQITLPSYVSVIEEVTGKREYSNAAMAENFPVEKEIF